MMTPEAAAALEAARTAEKAQALHYRALAARAEERGDEALAQRFHDLHADEQHHLSRLTARLVELGYDPESLDDARSGTPGLDAWEGDARQRELEEVRRYEQILLLDLDPATLALVREILAVERLHADELGGKWTMA